MSELILHWALLSSEAMLACAMICAGIRMISGPRAQDRILGLDTLYVNGMLVMLALGIRYASGMYFVAALVVAMFGFVGSAALAKFLLRGEVIE